MSKRKRSTRESLHTVLSKYQDDLFRALKAGKGFERQRLSKRLHEDGLLPDKKKRLDREVRVLKSLDLRQTARAHLISFLKVKSIASADAFPDDLRNGVPRPQTSEEERAALHNVTSSLYNREPVKQVIEQAIKTVCQALDLGRSDKSKSMREEQREEKQKAPQKLPFYERASDQHTTSAGEILSEEETDFAGFDSDADELGSAKEQSDGDSGGINEEEIDEMENLLASSSDEMIDDRGAASMPRILGKRDSVADELNRTEVRTKEKRTSARSHRDPVGDSTFLPSLMGGYISGSESASDIEEARPKKRRGQRARQAIWEKKYGASARHLKKSNANDGRDAGWDGRRGAIDGEERQATVPWKKSRSQPEPRRPRPDPVSQRSTLSMQQGAKQGPLHPSWEAKKKAQESRKALAFTGQKITFD